MTTERKRKKSEAIRYLESLGGGPLTLGRLIYAIRKGEEASQVDFAALLNISKAHLCDIEKDRRIVSPGRAYKWAKKLGYHPEQFMELAIQASLAKEGLHYCVKLQAA